MTNKNFDEGVNQREETPWSPASTIFNEAPNDAYRVSGGGVRGLLPPDSGTRNQPIRGRADLAPIPGCHGSQVINGTGVMTSPTNREVQGLVLEQMAHSVSMLQYDHSHTIAVQRGMPNKADYPTSGPRIPATLQFGLGNAYGRPGPSGHDPVDTVDTDGPDNYIESPSGLDRYVGASSVLQDHAEGQGYQPGWTRLHERSQFETMGEDILAGFGQREATLARSYIPPSKPVAPRSNRDVGQQLPRGRKGAR